MIYSAVCTAQPAVVRPEAPPPAGDGGAGDAGDSGAPPPPLTLLRVRFVGASFLYNQIRRMVGAAIAVSCGAMPQRMLEIALESPLMVRGSEG